MEKKRKNPQIYSVAIEKIDGEDDRKDFRGFGDDRWVGELNRK
jgi:hypothetical protein